MLVWRIGEDVFVRLICLDSTPPYSNIFLSIRRGMLRQGHRRRETVGYNSVNWFQCCVRKFLGMPRRCARNPSVSSSNYQGEDGIPLLHFDLSVDHAGVGIDILMELLTREDMPVGGGIRVGECTDAWVEESITETDEHVFLGMGEGGIFLSMDEFRNFALCCAEIKAALLEYGEGAIPKTPGNFRRWCVYRVAKFSAHNGFSSA